MTYAEEVIGLMECYPGREFRMAQIVRHVSRGMALSSTKRHAVRKGVERVLRSLYITAAKLNLLRIANSLVNDFHMTTKLK